MQTAHRRTLLKAVYGVGLAAAAWKQMAARGVNRIQSTDLA